MNSPKKENLEKLFHLIVELSEMDGNEWFKEKLYKKFSIRKVSFPESANDDIREIRGILQIRGDPSINYDFIKHKGLREQLTIDNLRMENAALNLAELNEVERFYNFCVNAFYQIENLINFYYHRLYPDIQDLLRELETVSSHTKYPFKRTGKEENVGDIWIAVKLFCFGLTFYNATNDFTSKNLSDLRRIRNEGLHRCIVIQNDREKDKVIFDFFKYQNFTTVRTILKKLVSTIKKEFQTKQFSRSANSEQSVELNGVVISKLPGGATIKFDNNEREVISEYKWVKNLSKDDKLKIKAIYKKGRMKIKSLKKI